jgi:hypothetical protein
MRMRSSYLLLFMFLSPALAQDAAPSAETLLRDAIAAEKAQADKGWKFTFREDEDKFPLDKNGKPLPESHSTYDNIMLEGDLYRKLILIAGKPPDEKLQKKINTDIEKERTARRAHPAQTGRHVVSVGDLDHITRLCDSKVTGEEAVSGRMAWRIESLPKAGYRPVDKDEEKFLTARRVTWIDEKEGFAIKYLEVFLRPTAGLQPGSEIEREFGKHGDAWLPDRMILRYDMRLYAVVRGRGESRYRYYDYKKFEVESKISIQ